MMWIRWVLVAADLNDGTVNLPAVVALGVSGSAGMFFIVRWMVRYQREFTDVYVAENKKLRDRVDDLEAERRAKDAEAAAAHRALMEYERSTQVRIRELELKVIEHEYTIAAQGVTISELSRRKRDGDGE